MKKIAIIIPTLSNGGAERIVSLLSNSLADEFKVELILYKDNITYPCSGNIKIIINKFNDNKLLKNFTRIYSIRKYLNQIKPDITLSFLTNPNIVNTLVGNGRKIISVRNMRSQSLKGLKGKIYEKLMKINYKQADKIVAISKGVRDDLIQKFNVDEDLIDVIYNFCDIEYIRRKKDDYIEPKHKSIFDKPTIITVGRLHEQKGQWHLIRAFEKVKQKIEDAQLVILGKGKLENYLKNLTEDLGLKESIHFLGFVENPFKYYNKSDLFVFPSLHEGFGNVILEAMVCGLPIISSDCQSGPREILADNIDYGLNQKEYGDYGVLLPVCDGNQYDAKEPLKVEEKVMADSIIEMLTDLKLYDNYKQKSLYRVNDFSVDRVIDDWIELINSYI